MRIADPPWIRFCAAQFLTHVMAPSFGWGV
jgi:hypothetical protein